MSTPSQLAQKIVAAVLADLLDRRGLRQELEVIQQDAEVWSELQATLAQRVDTELEPARYARVGLGETPPATTGRDLREFGYEVGHDPTRCMSCMDLFMGDRNTAVRCWACASKLADDASEAYNNDRREPLQEVLDQLDQAPSLPDLETRISRLEERLGSEVHYKDQFDAAGCIDAPGGHCACCWTLSNRDEFPPSAAAEPAPCETCAECTCGADLTAEPELIPAVPAEELAGAVDIFTRRHAQVLRELEMVRQRRGDALRLAEERREEIRRLRGALGGVVGDLARLIRGYHGRTTMEVHRHQVEAVRFALEQALRP